MRNLLIIIISFCSINAFACANAEPTDSPNFCASFKTAATCYCVSSGLPSSACQDINQIYDRMIFVFKTMEKACAYQTQTSSQDCINNWNCYRNGGIDSQGKLCSGTTLSCR